MAAFTTSDPAGTSLATTKPSPCAIFPSESEEYFCLGCNARCSGLGLLVGPHTNHDYLPLSDALLYMPAAMMRETREVMREVEESFTKPWRVHDQQRETTLLHLIELRRRKLAAVAQLMAELQQVDHRLLHLTETKALDLANWRYQHRGLHHKMTKLHRGATALAACFSEASSSPPGDGTACPLWSHTQRVAQKELGQVRQMLEVQLADLEGEEQASAQRLEAWHRLLSEVPWDGDASTGLGCTPNTTRGENAAIQPARPPAATQSGSSVGMMHTPLNQPPSQPHRNYSEPWHVCEAVAANAPCTNTTGAPERQQQLQTSFPPPSQGADAALPAHYPRHPSDAEVVLLQHALYTINSTLRQRLLNAAAVSLCSSSSSRSQPTSRHAFSEDAMATGLTISGLPPLPDATPLRSMQEFMKSAGSSGDAADSFVPHCATSPSERLPGDPHCDAAPSYTNPFLREPQGETSPQPRCVDAITPPAPTEAVKEEAVSDTTEAQRRLWWQSLQAREKEMKDSLNQLLQGNVTISSSP
ncbi:hypothetical protein JKF63_05460 [Porcisia hertigi]|uniref:Uncharacterized protein n=1 Tax=Porcisia hertigi TaxID=2761500 RepID=A0A836LDM9_9TRYP|nr:hypothetical protein JKF63_05460 [Porcisia hertigi]